jgi:two-component system LytT family response regulator
MTIRAIIVDDELAAIGNLSDLLIETGRVDIVGEFTNPWTALESLKSKEADIAFLDIEMPGIDGMTLANRMLDLSGDIKIVFVTAYQEYAIEAFALNATDYLLKPVSMARLTMTLNRVEPGQQPVHAGERKLQVSCFGKLRIDHDGRPVKWRTTKAEELFAYLLDQNGKEAGKEKLLAAIWGEFDDKRALTNFSTSLYYMRRTLKELGFPELLIVSNGMFLLDMEQIESDARLFEGCISSGDEVDRHNVGRFQQVIEQCGEGYMEANYYEWSDGKRRMFDEEYVEIAAKVAAYYREQHMENEAIAVLKKGLLKDMCHPELNRALLELFLEAGDRYSALKHYGEYKWRMSKEFGLEPDPSVMELRNKINDVIG